MPGSSSKAATRTEPTLPRCPATATLIDSVIAFWLASRAASAAAVAAATIAPAPAAVPAALARRRGHGQRGGHDLRVDALLDRQALRGQLLDRGLAAQVQPALAVDLGRLDHDLVAHVRDLLRPLDAVVGELGDVHETVLVRQDLDEHAEGHHPDDLAPVDPADLDLVGQALDPVDGALAALLVDRGDEHATVVLDVDLSTGLLGDLADHLASRADDVPDLVVVDHDRGDPGRVGAHLCAWLRVDSEHL